MDHSDLSTLLTSARVGDAVAKEALFSMAYDELRDVARHVRRGWDLDTLNTTALLHETFLKLAGERPLPAEDRAHFLAIVARAMRQVLIDQARRRGAEKRGGSGAAVFTLGDAVDPRGVTDGEFLALHRALDRLGTVDPRRAQVVEYRFIGGMSVEETALAMGISEPTVKRDWRVARTWLAEALSHPLED